jgi:hypothetical protein
MESFLGQQGTFKAIPKPVKSIRDDLKQRILFSTHSTGMKQFPYQTRFLSDILTIDPRVDPRSRAFEPWGLFFAYAILITFLILNLSQFIDIFSKNTKLVMWLNIVRLVIYLAIFWITLTSVIKGWRTVEINITFQVVIVCLSVVSSLAAIISRFVLFIQKKEQKGFLDYSNIVIPIIVLIISVIGMISLIRRWSNGILIGEVSMLFICASVLFSVLMVIFKMIQTFMQTYTPVIKK